MAQWLRIYLPVQGHGFDPGSGKIPHALGHLSLCAPTTCTKYALGPAFHKRRPSAAINNCTNQSITLKNCTALLRSESSQLRHFTFPSPAREGDLGGSCWKEDPRGRDQPVERLRGRISPPLQSPQIALKARKIFRGSCDQGVPGES